MSTKRTTTTHTPTTPAKKAKTSPNSKQWLAGQDTEAMLNHMKKAKTTMTTLPNNAGHIMTFKDSMAIKLVDSKLMSAVDENNKVCFSLDDEAYAFLEAYSEQILSTLVARMKLLHPEHEDAEMWPVIKISEQTETKYLKTKVQTVGASRSMGCTVDGHITHKVLECMTSVGSVVDVRIKLDGVYLTKDKCGLMTKVDMFRVKSIPTEEEIEADKAEKMKALEEARKEAFDSF